MFLTYLWRELRQRNRQAMLIVAGLAIGIGLVLTVTAASAGVGAAQTAVLHSLYGLGTDLTVTPAPADEPDAPSSDTDSLTLGEAGLLSTAELTALERLPYVSSAAGGLTLTEVKLPAGSGAFPVPTTVSVDGLDVNHLDLGPYASARLASGRTFTKGHADANVAVLDATYATSHRLHTGSTISIAHTPFTVIGTVRQTHGGGAVDAYIPLARAQALATTTSPKPLTGQVDVIYVAADSAANVSTLQAEISKLLPATTVTTSGNLADAVSGSLANAATLASQLGAWLKVGVLIATFAVASLQSLAAVTRRVREFGTLKALGWRTRRIVAQIMGESAVTGLIGAALGVGFGFGGATLIDAIAPTLSASPAHGANSAALSVHLTARVTFNTIALAVFLAIAGSLIAGAVGARRASRLRPADALAQIE